MGDKTRSQRQQQLTWLDMPADGLPGGDGRTRGKGGRPAQGDGDDDDVGEVIAMQAE